jgi:putative FmdB family regulatory protein
MPTYEYECKKCKDRFEVFQSMTAKPLKKCKKCQGSLKRLIGSGAGIIFKGSGFYATDYRKTDYKAKANAEKTSCSACNNSKACSINKKAKT